MAAPIPNRAICSHEARNRLETPGIRAACSMWRTFINGKLNPHRAQAMIKKNTGIRRRLARRALRFHAFFIGISHGGAGIRNAPRPIG